MFEKTLLPIAILLTLSSCVTFLDRKATSDFYEDKCVYQVYSDGERKDECNYRLAPPAPYYPYYPSRPRNPNATR